MVVETFKGARIIHFERYDAKDLVLLVEPLSIVNTFCSLVGGPYMFTRRRPYVRHRETVSLACAICNTPTNVLVPIPAGPVYCDDCAQYMAAHDY